MEPRVRLGPGCQWEELGVAEAAKSPVHHLSAQSQLARPCAHAHRPAAGVLGRAQNAGVDGGMGAQARGRAGAQWCGWCVGANPGRHTQRKEPSVLTQRALTQSGEAASASSHSLISTQAMRVVSRR